VVLYGCETWSLTSREEEHREGGGGVLGNKVLWGTFGSMREKLTGGWRKMHNEELHNLYSSTNIIAMMRSTRMSNAGHVERMGERKNVYRILLSIAGEKLLRRSI
jgi:hypothetical protein